jgi:RNA polymerase sigma factor (sigma-70 family)
MSASFTIAAPELVDSLATEVKRATGQLAKGQHGAAGLSPHGSFPPLLADVWRLEAGRLASLAAGMGLARETAADVLQEVYLRALASPPPLDREPNNERSEAHPDATTADEDLSRREQLVRWLFRVTANECRLVHRQSGRRQRLWSTLATELPGDSELATEPTAGARGSMQFGELKQNVDAALAQLTEDDRLLVVLRYFLNWNSRQIAELVEQPESTIRGRLRACRLWLASELAEWNDER